MDTKLTLKLDKSVIDKAKIYASSRNSSLSRIIESYLRLLIDQEGCEDKNEIQISPYVNEMTMGGNIPVDLDYRKEYSNHLIEKYK